MQYFEKKRWTLEVISFWNYRVENVVLLTCLKRLVSEHLWMVKMLKRPKDCLNLNSNIFPFRVIMLFDHSERKSARKIMSQWYLISRDCLLTYWHPMKCILSQEKRVFTLTYSNVIIFKPRNILSIFCCIFAIEIKFEILWTEGLASKVISFWNYRVEKVYVYLYA